MGGSQLLGKQRITKSDKRYQDSEEDGKDEAMSAADGKIVDDWFRDNFVKKLPRGTTTVAMFDCCHSGTMLDLPYQCRGSKSRGFRWSRNKRQENPKNDDPFVLYLPGCEDTQTSKEVARGGVLTSSFLDTFDHYGKDMSLENFINKIQHLVHANADDQKPRLSCSHDISLKKSFSQIIKSCPRSECTNVKSKSKSFCKDHRCLRKGGDCSSEKSSKKSFCEDHRCPHIRRKGGECSQEKSSSKSFCEGHRCPHIRRKGGECSKEKSSSKSFCEDHRCPRAGGKCTNEKSSRHKFCKEHRRKDGN